MTQIQIDLPEDINTWLAHKSIDLSFHDKRMVIIKILKEVMKKDQSDIRGERGQPSK
jgi:hypothetical protein